MNQHSRRNQPRAVLLLAACTAVTACDLDNLLDVSLPGNVLEESLNDPALAPVLAQSVVADFECAWNNYVTGTALISDQFIQASGNLVQRNWGTRRVTSSDASYAQSGCNTAYGIYTTLHTARFQAEDVFRRISNFPEAQVPNRTRLLATARVYGAYALVALGEGFCEMAIDLGPLLTRADVLRLAENRFTEALALATESSTPDLLNMALVGRARARLDLEDFAGAIADAARVPAGYLKNATRDESAAERYNGFCNHLTCAAFGRHASIAPNYRDVRWEGVPDPRVQVTTTNGVAFDNATTHWFPANRFRTRSDPIQIASHREAQLIIAEASVRTGDLTTARRIINELHAAAGIPGYDPANTATASEVGRQVIEERRRELFLEGGHRFNDHFRLRGTEWAVPYRGEPGSIHPDGVDHTGVPYGSTTCFALPDVERVGNPNL
jgi:hypothetical protein